VAAPATWGARRSGERGKRRGDHGEHVGLLTLDGERRQTAGGVRAATAGGGSKRWRRFSGQLATRNGRTGSSRREDARGDAHLSGRSTKAANRRWQPATWLGSMAGGGTVGRKAKLQQGARR
jgi:hypothetical protein